MSTRHQKSFVIAAVILILFSSSASAARPVAHNLILVIPEALPALGIDESNAPALARLRREGVTFANSLAGFPRLTPSASFIDASDLGAESLLAAATDRYTVAFVPNGYEEKELQRLVNTTLPQAKSRNRPFFIVYQVKEPKGLDMTEMAKTVRPAYKPNPRPVDTALETIEASLKTLGLYDTTNIVVAAEHGFSRVLKVSNTSRGRSLLPREENLGILRAGFLAIDIINALPNDNLDLQLFDPDAGNIPIDWTSGAHPSSGNAIIARSYSASNPYVTVEAHGSYDSIFLRRSFAERPEMARRILEMLSVQDYVGGVFVNEKTVGPMTSALPLSHITRHGEVEGLPDIVVVFFSSRDRCVPTEVCTSVIADTPLAEGEGIANVFSRTGTYTFMAARGPDFQTGFTSQAPASNADINRTIAELLGLDLVPTASKARVLREALNGDRYKAAPQATSEIHTSMAGDAGRVTELHQQTLGSTAYLECAVPSRQEYLADDLDRPHWPWLHLPRPKTLTITISGGNGD